MLLLAAVVHVKIVQEVLVLLVVFKVLNIFRNVSLQDLNVFHYLFELILSIVFCTACLIQGFRRILRLLLDSVEEVDEQMRVLLEHILRTSETILSHGCHLGKALDLGLLDLQHLLHQSDLSLLFNELPPILPVLGPLNRNGEPGSLSHIDFALNLWVDGQLRWLYVGFTNLAEAALPRGPVLFPNAQLLVLLSLDDLAVLLRFFEREDKFVRRQLEWIVEVVAELGLRGRGCIWIAPLIGLTSRTVHLL